VGKKDLKKWEEKGRRRRGGRELGAERSRWGV